MERSCVERNRLIIKTLEIWNFGNGIFNQLNVVEFYRLLIDDNTNNVNCKNINMLKYLKIIVRLV